MNKEQLEEILNGSMVEIPENERVRFAEENGARLREEYCQKYCQVTKFERRYIKPVQKGELEVVSIN